MRCCGRFGSNGAAAVAQLVERVLGKDEVMGSSPISSLVVFGCKRGVEVFGDLSSGN